MKALLYLSLCLLGLLLPIACHKRGETPVEAATDSIPTDTIDSLPVDTTDTLQMAAPPKKADEFFDDFVFAFMKSSKFQRSRISFPLAHIVDGRSTTIERKRWRFDRMYSDREVYTLIFDSRKGMRLAKDTSIHHVIVEDFDLSEQRVKTYDFARQEGEWRLNQLSEGSMKDSDNADFYDFYHRFANDALFREQHINDPLQFITFDEESFQPIEGFISPNQWDEFAPELPTTQLTNIHYQQQKPSTKLRILNISALSGGMSSTLTFKHIKGEWVLVKLEN